MSVALLLCCAFLLAETVLAQTVACKPGYTCWKDSSSSITWVKKDSALTYGPSCRKQCEEALCQTGTYHRCDPTATMFHDVASFRPVSDGLGFNCTNGGCWGARAGEGQLWVHANGAAAGSTGEKKCWFSANATFDCDKVPGNANCYRERFALVCPCVSANVESACSWKNPGPNKPAAPRFPLFSNGTLNPTGTSCLERINYWRKRACDEGWVECPPCGLPPMTECTCCNECANSQAEYDRINGAHKSFTRCGDRVQGVGGGQTCANVIDAFVSERTPDANGTWRCQGHCGPIVAHGCQTFFWGKSETGNTHVLNWRTCDEAKCATYCDNPTRNGCFALNASIAPNTADCPAPGSFSQTSAGTGTASGSGSSTAGAGNEEANTGGRLALDALFVWASLAYAASALVLADAM